MLNVSLTPEAQTFIQQQLANGKYRSTDEVLLAGLELLATKDASEQARYAQLRQDIDVGLAEAEAGKLIDGEELFGRLRQKLQQQRQNEI